MKRYALRDVNVARISICKRGANGQRIFLMKSAEEPDTELGGGRLLKAEGDWSKFYIVVAEPGREEMPGQTGERDSRDVWSAEEIEKAAHRFLKNGGAINRAHESIDPYGQLVENAIALSDITIGGQTIKKGSWYIAVEPTDEGREMIDRGDFSGVSIEGAGIRELMKAAVDADGIGENDDADLDYLDQHDRDALQFGIAEIAKATTHTSAAHGSLDWSSSENWIDKLPAAVGAAFRRSWIYRTAKHLVYDKGMDRGRAFAVAINAAKRGCATGDLNFKGSQSVNAKSRAEMCAAVATWNAAKAANKAQRG